MFFFIEEGNILFQVENIWRKSDLHLFLSLVYQRINRWNVWQAKKLHSVWGTNNSDRWKTSTYHWKYDIGKVSLKYLLMKTCSLIYLDAICFFNFNIFTYIEQIFDRKRVAYRCVFLRFSWSEFVHETALLKTKATVHWKK